jgi:uncharacterized membrane protein HdeD (DUF308 family)
MVSEAITRANLEHYRWGVGVVSLAISLIIIVHPVNIGLPLLGAIISVALLISGIEMMVIGITGRPKDRLTA